MSYVDWTVVTVTHNSARRLEEFWTSPPPDGVSWIVVDNASSDGSASTAWRLGATDVIELSVNVGFSKANNIGWRSTSSPYVAFINPDVAVGWRGLEPLADVLDSRAVLVAPQLLNRDGSLQPNGRGEPTIWAKLGNRSSLVRSDSYRRYADLGQILDVSWFIGAAVAARRETLERLSGWDERYFLYYEDSDLGMRARRLGLTSVVHGDVRWVHGWERETTKLHWRPWAREFRAAWRFYRTYPSLLIPRMWSSAGLGTSWRQRKRDGE